MSNRSVPPATEERLAFNEVWDQSNPSLAYQVYLLRDRRGKPLYIGVTSGLKMRVYDHWQRKPWGKEIAKIEVVVVAHGSYSATLAERTAIQNFRPKHNIVHNSKTARSSTRSRRKHQRPELHQALLHILCQIKEQKRKASMPNQWHALTESSRKEAEHLEKLLAFKKSLGYTEDFLYTAGK